VTGARLGLHRTVIDIHGTQNLEAQVPTPKTRRDRASAVQRRNVIQNAVLGRAHGMTHLLYGVPQCPTGVKNIENLEGFQGLEASNHRSRSSRRPPTSLSVIYM
jgi:hypothetical protein